MFRIEHNVETGEVIQVEMTESEIAEYNKLYAEAKKENEAQLVALTELEAKRQALLDKLGITEEEARLLLGGN